jgi:hypothetical protein
VISWDEAVSEQMSVGAREGPWWDSYGAWLEECAARRKADEALYWAERLRVFVRPDGCDANEEYQRLLRIADRYRRREEAFSEERMRYWEKKRAWRAVNTHALLRPW